MPRTRSAFAARRVGEKAGRHFLFRRYKVASARAAQFSFVEVAALVCTYNSPFPLGDISRVVYNACTHVCTHLSSVIQFREGMQRTRDWREKRGESIYLIFQATAATHARIRTCVAIKPQKLFFLSGVLPLSSPSFHRGRAAGASANAVITPLECTRVYTHRPRRSMTNLEASGSAAEPFASSTLKISILFLRPLRKDFF